jgi:hypothetical protein
MNCVIAARSLLLALALTLGSQAVLAARVIPWDSLNETEQSALRQYRGNWSNITPGEQQKLRQGARKYLELSPQQRQAIERKRSQYEKMPPHERQQLRKEYRRQKQEQ